MIKHLYFLQWPWTSAVNWVLYFWACYSKLITFFFIQQALHNSFMSLQKTTQEHMLHFPKAKIGRKMN